MTRLSRRSLPGGTTQGFLISLILRMAQNGGGYGPYEQGKMAGSVCGVKAAQHFRFNSLSVDQEEKPS